MAKGSGDTRSYRSEVGLIASNKIKGIISEIRDIGFSREAPVKIGGVEKRMRAYAESHNITLGSSDVYMSPQQIAHALRDSKQAKGKSVDTVKLEQFPAKRYGMKLYYEKEGNGFVYFDGENKYIVHPNYRIKLPTGKEKVVNFITATKSNGEEFNLSKYEEIKKK